MLAKEIASITLKVEKYNRLEKILNDTFELLDLIDDSDDDTGAEITSVLEKAKAEIEEMRLASLLKGKYDKLNAILTLHSGAGGTEACDWTEMLYRMYILYCEKNGLKLTELDRLDGDEAGIKSVSFKVDGECAYGYLKAEKGVHRLVRISPFDANIHFLSFL